MHICTDSSESFRMLLWNVRRQFFNRAGSQTLIAGRKERERERERETAWCLHTNLLFWLGLLESETQFWVKQSILSQRFRWGPMRGSRKFCQRGSDSARVFFLCLFRGERIQISLKASHHRPARENGVSLACRWWPNVERWLRSFENFRGSGPVLLRNSIFFRSFRGGGGVRTT